MHCICLVCNNYIFACLCCQEGKQALLKAAETGNIAAVKRQLSGHTDVNSQDKVIIPAALSSDPSSCNFHRMDSVFYIMLPWVVIAML